MRRIASRRDRTATRRGARAAAVVLGLGVLLLVVLLVAKRSDQAFTLGAAPSGVAAQLQPGQEVCQAPIDVPDGASFDSVRLPVGTYGKPGPELRVTVRDRRNRIVARRTVPAGYRDGGTLEVPIGRSLSGTGFGVCFANEGRTDLGLYGTGGGAVVDSALTIDGGDDTTADLALSFGRPAQSLLSGVPDLLERATLFRSPRLPAALYGIVLALLLGAAGWGLVATVRAAEEDASDADRGDDRASDADPGDGPPPRA